MASKTCLYFLTFKTSDMYEDSLLWDNKELQKTIEAPIEKYYENLKQARVNGGEILKISGGDPFLFEQLPDFLQKAKSLGFSVHLKTNGLLYADFAKKIKGLTDKLFFFIDYPTQEEHNESRGIECFNVVIDAIRYAIQLQQNPIIEFNLTRDNVRFLPEMVELSQKLRVKLYLHTAYERQGSHGFENETYAYIKYFLRNREVFINLAELEFLKNHGNKTALPRCRAKETTITYLPDGTKVSPCFYNQTGKQGREPVCYGCVRWLYMIPSFEIGFDKYKFLSWYSKWIKSRKEQKL
ncbi:hypothetical protein A3J90_03350 [candidate division WOR-1 bacterium RIFOXYC2_FULL_37_10]|uniref:Radical SAM core domain-containing protein n=1 Tax=candidate division WOR-1 bacterium RIFOXYB2_FULL_37_13 TaxID=1802579 RepID=A0A1F4SKS0_UNCSA|nr:MAG: hypothetical protein A2310_00715 [candidate division WOR-1 bacterium RIFOXYB2_FULL_37_13]OGC36782.1 MAG: hypothetical protein A3J90_03350 [candidate division WOR-1 bacterium RIFOXYC2_FULL_37_10]